MKKDIKSLIISGLECLPIVEGGKGIGVSNFATAGAFAKCGAVGTISAVNPDIISENGEVLNQIIKAKNRFDRHVEMIENAIKGTISQIKRAKDIAGEKGRIHINALWEMGGTEHILNETLDKVKDLVNGVVCGAGMPYKLSEIASKYKTYYYPIVSSMRAFRILWVRSFHKTKEWLGGVVYECPWRAGGHNGLTNAEDPFVPQDTYPRVVELRKFMNEVGLQDTPIIVAGGVWNIEEYEKYLDNPEIGKVAFQFGTRPMLTQESPISDYWKQLLLNAKKEDVITNHFSPTGFYSSAMNTELLKDLTERLKREVEYKLEADNIFNTKIVCGKSERDYFVKESEKQNIENWIKAGNTEAIKTPDNTIVFVSEETANEIRNDLKECIGCLSRCQFSSWSQNEPENHYNTGILPDPRKFCIQKALQFAHKGINNAKALFFSGTNAYRFGIDPFYKDGFIPTIKQLVDKIMEGK
ncbi:MAG TPA: nitronate monooxygenase [Rickettsiales bacterium]|nr:nitronate monooxygenase [Rickettsiales bacterium]